MLLAVPTSPAWTRAVLSDFDAFLLDHAACERKASASAIKLVTHYPDRAELVEQCIALAREELHHFQQVAAWIAKRGLMLGPDRKDEYMARLKAEFRRGTDVYFLERLVAAGIVEARGCERFGLVAAALPEGELREFYREIARSEVRHQDLFLDLARKYFDEERVATRLSELREIEGRIIADLPIRPALY